MSALELFETLEFGPEHTGPALFPVALYKSDVKSLTFTATKDGKARLNTAREVVLVHFCLEAGSLLEEQAAEAVLRETRFWSPKVSHSNRTRAFMVRHGIIKVDPGAGAYRVVRQGRSGLVVLDASFVW